MTHIWEPLESGAYGVRSGPSPHGNRSALSWVQGITGYVNILSDFDSLEVCIVLASSESFW